MRGCISGLSKIAPMLDDPPMLRLNPGLMIGHRGASFIAFEKTDHGFGTLPFSGLEA
jgi:hypothetical protein